MKRKLIAIMMVTCMMLMSVVTTRAGGSLESIDITAGAPSPIAGHILARVIGIRWDARSIPVQYKVNNTLNPIPNPLGPAFLSLGDATTALQASFDRWNNLPSSYIDMQIVGTTNNPGLVGFNFINELSFRTAAGFGAIASSPSTNLISDATFSNGDDIDGDGDSDVSSAITTAGDADSDGDIEFPAGLYEAGTILDNDVQFNTKTSNGLRFTIDPAQADATTRSVDLECVATHEFGHSFGLSHVLNNQTSATDGDGATMFPFIDTGDPAAEIAQRSPDSDDIAYASYFYPEGSAATGPAALQSGDIAFNKVYGLITGELTHGVLGGQSVAGGYLHAINRDTGEEMVGAFSGTTNLSFNPANGGLFFVPSVADAIPNGNYVIPVPQGNYNVRAEAVDGSPVAAANISFTCQIGQFFGQQNFIEEFWNNNKEGVLEREPGDGKNAHVNPGKTTSDVNIATNSVFSISNFGARTNIGFINPPAGGFIYATAYPASQINAINSGDVLFQAGLIDTIPLDASVPAQFAKVSLAKGVINPDGTASIDLVAPLDSSINFLGQDTDFSPFYFHDPKDLSETIRAGIADGSIQNLFVVVEILNNRPFAGISNQPLLIGLSAQAPIHGLSFLSTNAGTTFARRNDLNFRISLIMSQPVN